MAKCEKSTIIIFLFGVVTGVSVLYAIIKTPGYHQYILHLKTGTGRIKRTISFCDFYVIFLSFYFRLNFNVFVFCLIYVHKLIFLLHLAT